MPDKKISELSSLLSADLVSDDVFPVVDVSATETKKITLLEMFAKGSSLVSLADLADVNATPSLNTFMVGDGSSWESATASQVSSILLPSTVGQVGKVLKVIDTSDGLELSWEVDQTADGGSLTGKTVVGYFPAASMRPSTTNGSGNVVTVETPTNNVMYSYLPYDAGSIEYAQFSFKCPSVYDESAGFTAIIEWAEANGATTHDCVWQVEMQAQSDGDAIDSAWGTAVTVTDTGTPSTRRFTDETGTITPSGTWTTGDNIIVRISRKATDVADTLNIDAFLIGVTLFAQSVTLIES